jgi:hypothetical protein
MVMARAFMAQSFIKPRLANKVAHFLKPYDLSTKPSLSEISEFIASNLATTNLVSRQLLANQYLIKLL